MSRSVRSTTSAQHEKLPLAALEHGTSFADRHVGPDHAGVQAMLDTLGIGSLEELASRAVPSSILQGSSGSDSEAAGIGADLLPTPANEVEALAELRGLARRNQPMEQMLGLGYAGTVTPAVIRRNVLENPAWYTAYTPYQPEISQGRLEAVLNFQTMISDLTGLAISGASLLDEATAAAEAMTLLRRAGRARSARFLVDTDALPQTRAVLQTRAEPLGIELVEVDFARGIEAAGDGEFFGALLSYPGASGRVPDAAATRELIAQLQQRGASVAVSSDPLALVLLQAPGELGADAVLGTTQRFGVPMGFGGPHAGFLSVRKGLERQLPGRLVGVSTDAEGVPAYRLALQTREQHIRREKATSNICTAQVLLAVMAGMYGVYHGAEGLAGIAQRVHRMATVLAGALRSGGFEITHSQFFDTLRVRVPGRADAVIDRAREEGVNLLRVSADEVGISCGETTTRGHLLTVLAAFGLQRGLAALDEIDSATPDALGEGNRRSTEILTHPVFSQYRSETAMLRYLRALSDRDLALDRSMIPLGSCTMKLNATAEMEPVTWPEFTELHPFAPAEDAEGLLRIVGDLERWLVQITGYDAVSLQPNAGSQGEFAGLLAIRAFHRESGNSQRDICLIPSSAHGTNAASAVMAGMRVQVVRCDDGGNIDLAHLRELLEAHGSELAAIMLTYPSTHGVYESTVTEVCGMVHDAGGQVYLDGANLNALMGLARPGRFGADVSHLNLHKTFCIPHGGGGPGVGPVGVRAHLAPYLPNHPLQPAAGPDSGVGPVAAAPWGSASILPISWAYVRMMGLEGLRRSSLTAVVAANYIAHRLNDFYPVLYSGEGGLVAHECILDLRRLTRDTGITVDDVAKRLADYGLHAPTMSFPVAGTLMVEPTESEDLDEIDRFCDAMIAIRAEAERVSSGDWSAEDNPLVNAPHPARRITGEWNHSYSRDLAAFPQGHLRSKVWPAVGRIDQAGGDRNLMCSCPPLEDFAGLE